MMEKVSLSDIRRLVSPEEWQIRVDLAAAYRLVALFGWDDLVFTHISARIPGPEHHFLINPYGMLFDEITASSLVKVDQSANVLLDNGFPINPAGFLIHSAIHSGHPNAHCVLHIHTVSGVAVACLKEGLLPISQQATLALASLAYHDYEGIAINEAEKARFVADLGDATSLILRNHGLLTVGGTIADAFLTMYNLERACEIQIRAQAANGTLIPVDDRVLAGVKAAARTVTLGQAGGLVWPGLLRRLDRLNPGYAE
jgi:ribulose-5-phosphate 4-epimerase/fuculose-1-phosphate aldolase